MTNTQYIGSPSGVEELLVPLALAWLLWEDSAALFPPESSKSKTRKHKLSPLAKHQQSLGSLGVVRLLPLLPHTSCQAKP